MHADLQELQGRGLKLVKSDLVTLSATKTPTYFSRWEWAETTTATDKKVRARGTLRRADTDVALADKDVYITVTKPDGTKTTTRHRTGGVLTLFRGQFWKDIYIDQGGTWKAQAEFRGTVKFAGCEEEMGGVVGVFEW